MNGVALLVALSALGIDHTWRQTQDGQIEYVLQVEPVFLEALAEGKEINSELPAGIERVDRLCIRIGSGSLKTLSQSAPDWPELNQPPEQQAAERAVPDVPLSILLEAGGDAYESYDLAHGWRPANTAESTYLVQLDPKFLKLLKEGDEVYTAIRPEAGVVRSFKVTAGRKPLPQEAARPPVMTVAQLQAQGPRGSSPAADVPPVSDFTGGNSVYDGQPAADPGDTTAIAESGNAGAARPTRSRFNFNDARNVNNAAAGKDKVDPAPTAALEPPVSPLLEVPAFDNEQFGRPRGPASNAVRTGTSRPAARPPSGGATAPRYAEPPSAAEPRETYPPAGGNAALAEYQRAEEPDARLAARTPAVQGEQPQRGANLRSSASEEEKKPELPAWPLFFTVCALFLSIGGNLYLGWTAAEFYSRYRLAVERLRSAAR